MFILDPTKYAVVSDEGVYNATSQKTIAIKGWAAFAIHNTGTVDMILGNGIEIPAGKQYSDCGLCCLPFKEDKTWKFTSTGAGAKFTLVRSRIVEQDASCPITPQN